MLSLVIIKPVINLFDYLGFLYLCRCASLGMTGVGRRIEWLVAGEPAVCVCVLAALNCAP